MRTCGSGRNRVRPVTADPPSDPAIRPRRSSSFTRFNPSRLKDKLQSSSDMKAIRQRTLGGHVDKTTKSRKERSFLGLSLRLFEKNTPAEVVQSVTPQSTPETPPSENTDKITPVTPDNKPSTHAQLSETVCIAGMKGALGLTPVTEMFKMQSFSTKDMSQAKRSGKGTEKTPAKRHSKRKILKALNGAETSGSPQAVSAVKSTYTFTARKSERLSEQLLQRQGSVTGVRPREALTRDWSTGTLSQTLESLDMSMESSIMKALYPAGSGGGVDESVLSDSMYSPDTTTTDGETPLTSQGNPRLQRTHSMRMMQRNLSDEDTSRGSRREVNTTVTKSSAVNLSAIRALKSTQSTSSCFYGKSELETSYVRAAGDAGEMGQREAGETGPGKRRSAAARGSALNTTWSGGEACRQQAVRRSRSLRVGHRQDGLMVTGHAGHTPRPRRRRPSYEERLIM